MGMFGYRVMGAALLDRSIYEGIEADSRASGQALLVVLLSSLAAGIGTSGWHGPTLGGIVTITALALVTWVAWATLMLQIGGRLLRTSDTRTSQAELMRTIGFAASPGLLQAFAAFPRVTVLVFAVSWLWMFVATVVAVRQALDFTSTARTLAVCAVAAGLALAGAFLISALLGPALAPAG
ncbi:MAG: hypothetical protein ABS36_10610 [Acidobacteria bacterium SCN 69-37]|nr:MAG: hypothetical protein ABS36_10610 [Acidobacteria bacterium SCN 69-37]